MDRGRETADFGGVTLDGRYRLGDRRDDGAHDGVHLPTGRRVIVRQAPGGHPEALRLKRTLQRVIGLDHPAVVPIIDAGAGENGLYLVEHHLEGEPLSALLGHAQPADRVADVVRQLVRVLAEVHGRGLVHGALRPECILLQQTTGRSDYVRLAGLGLAATPFAPGAGPWIAPELRAGQPADARSDLYTVGLIGRALLGGLSPAEAGHGPLPGAPPQLVEVLDAVCRRSPAQRPPSAVALLGPIERATSVGASRGRAMADTMVSTGPLPRMDGPPPPPVGGAPIDAPPAAPARRSLPWPWLAAVAVLLGVIAALLLRDGPTAPEPAAATAPAVVEAAEAPAAPAATVEAAAGAEELPDVAPDAAPPAADAAAPDAAAPDAAAPDAAAPKIIAPARPPRRPPIEKPVPRPPRPAPTPRPTPTEADPTVDYEKL